MEPIKAGYKKTEVGLIPEDWECELLDKNSQRGSGHTPNKRVKEYYEGNIVWVSLADSDRLDKREINSSTITISNKGIANSSAVLHPRGVVLMSRDAGIGKSAVAGCPLCVSQHFITWLPNEKTLHNWFLYYWLQFQKSEFERIAIGSTIKTIGLPYFKKYRIVLPQYVEQKAIADALSDVDALIESLEKLIAKKKAIKQGAMQALLTPPHKGGKRLDGFSGEWKEVRLGEIGNVTGAGVDKKIHPDEPKVTLLNYLDVYRKDFLYSRELNHVVTAPEYKIQNCSVCVGDVFLTPSSELRTDIGVSALSMENMENVVYSYHLYRLRFFKPIDALFSLYMLKTKKFLSQAETMCEGSGKRYVVSMSKYEAMKVEMPIDIEEQKSIGECLYNMDKELSALEKKKSKLQSLKQGMMQELLTGKTRLI